MGRSVAKLEDGRWLTPGTHRLTWDRRRSDGAVAAPGVYFVRIDNGARTWSRRVVIAGS